MSETVLEWTVLLLAAIGIGFMLVSSVGMFKLPDFYTRLHAASTARTLGIGVLLLAVALYDRTAASWAKMLALLIFFLFTTPITAHLLGRAVYRIGGGQADLPAHDALPGQRGSARRPPRS